MGPRRGQRRIGQWTLSVECKDRPDVGLDKSEGVVGPGSVGQVVERELGELNPEDSLVGREDSVQVEDSDTAKTEE